MDIDPNLVNLLVAYAANVGADATRWVAAKFTRGETPGTQKTAGELNLSVQALLTERGIAEIDSRRVATFLLETPILGYLFVLVSAATQSEEYRELPEEEVAALLILEAELSANAAITAATALVEVLAAANEKVSNSPRRYRRVQRNRNLSGIQLFGAQEAKRQFFSEIGTPSLGSIQEYSTTFRREMARKFDRIQLQHLDNGTEQRLEDLYVDPDLLPVDGDPSDADELKPIDVLTQYGRAVILGPAGSGKSTTVRRLAATLAGDLSSRTVPIVVELRKFLAQQELVPQLFIEHISNAAAQSTQRRPPASWVEYLLVTGRAVVFFDGLDEILSAGTRAEVRDAVLSFAQLFPASSIVVTSRFTGYDLAPLDAGEWAHVEVAELSEEQVRDYATRWFTLKDASLDIANRAQSFIDESRDYAHDLRANPLMLSLLCSVYYMRGDIPRTLHALYERCADMIYQQWNTMRGIEDHRAWDKDVRPVLYQVAHAVLNNDEFLSEGIPEDELVSEIRRAFLANGAPDAEEASRRAREAVSLWAGRAWIITAVMTDEYGRPQYGFVHQSFLEYFAAVYEVRRVDTPAELYSNLRPRLIELNGWSVTQIAVSVTQAWKDRGGERFLDALLAEVDDACDLDALALWRLALSLVSIVPIPSTQLTRMTCGALGFVARSVVLPDGESTTNRALKSVRTRSRDLERFESADNTIDQNSADSRRLEIVLPTSQSDVILRDIANVANATPSHSAVMHEAVLSTLDEESDELIAAALLQCALLEEVAGWPEEFGVEARQRLESKPGMNWVVAWIATQIKLLPIYTGLSHVPWHAALLDQALILSDEVDVYGPEVFESDLAACIDRDETYRFMEMIGERVARQYAAGKHPAEAEEFEVKTSFVFADLNETWRSERDPDSWSDAFLVAFSMLGKLASVSWRTGLALGELVEGSERAIVRQVAAASAGWGSVAAEELATVASPYRETIEFITRSSWPRAA